MHGGERGARRRRDGEDAIGDQQALPRSPGLQSEHDQHHRGHRGDHDLEQPVHGQLVEHEASPSTTGRTGVAHAARILARKSWTWPRSRSAWLVSASAAALTPCAAVPVASAPAVTPAMLSETSWVRCAAAWVLRVISWVAAPCCSTAEAIEVATELTSPIVPPIRLIASTASLVTACTAAIWAEISSVALAVWLAKDLTSEATTAKPLPASPARAASMVAFSASRLVWAAMVLIRPTTSPTLSAMLTK